MIDLDQDVSVYREEQQVFRGKVPRTIQTLERTLSERGDPQGMYPAEILIK